MIMGIRFFFACLLLLCIVSPKVLSFFLGLIFPQTEQLIYPRASLLIMLFQHVYLTLVSGSLAIFSGICIGIFVTRPVGKDFFPLVQDISSLAQTFPPIAVLTLAVPILGFGFQPAVLALFLYSVLPVLNNTTSGIQSISNEITEAARGMGMKNFQVLTKIELPIAAPVIMAGVRTALVINIGTATIGAVVGAGGLGVPIVAGLSRNNTAFIVQGAFFSAMLALMVDRILERLESSFFSKH